VGTLAVTVVLRREMSASRAGSRGDAPGWCGRLGWRTGLPPSLEALDDDHAPAAAEMTGLDATIAVAFSSEDIGDLDRGAQVALGSEAK
jgi:hypothetical protein